MCWCKATWWKVQFVQFPLSFFLWDNDDGSDCQYLLNTVCQVLFLGSKHIISLFTSLRSIFSLIYRQEIWLGCNLHGKEKNLHPLSECPVSVFLAFSFPCPYMRTLPNSLFNISLFADLISFSLWAHSLSNSTGQQIRVHRPDCHSSLFPSLPTSHTQLNGSAGPSNWTIEVFY